MTRNTNRPRVHGPTARADFCFTRLSGTLPRLFTFFSKVADFNPVFLLGIS